MGSVIAACLCAGATAWAVKPSTWLHRTEADFSAAETDGVLVTNLGEVRLARATRQRAALPGDASAVFDLERLPGGDVIIAAGPGGSLLRLPANADKPSPLHTYEDEQVFALAGDKQGLWVGVSGNPSRIEYRSGDDLKVQRTIELPEVRYVWDVLVDRQRLWLATGTEGRVLTIDTTDAQAKPAVALDAKQANVLCLGIDSMRRVYAGTDTDGLVYRITPRGEQFETFILFDADEPEIGALWVEPDGTVYAGTADAKQARPGRLQKAEKEPTGRPVRPKEGERTEPELPNVPPKPQPQPAGKAPAAPAQPKPAAPAAAPQDGPQVDAPPAKPTPEQYEKLRDVVRQRLETAKKSGRLEMAEGGPAVGGTPSVRQRSSAARRSGGASGAKAGNAIYRINKDGFVKAVFRESVMILKLLRSGSALWVATGNEGQLYRVDPDAGEVTTLAALEPRQVPALLDLGEGHILAGTANPGRLVSLEAERFATGGTIVSPALDAQQVSLWGKLRVMARIPEGTSLTMQTRSGNVGDPDSGSWSDWSQPVNVTAADSGASAFLEIRSPSARFLQYRLALGSDGRQSPSVDAVSLMYLMPNLEPSVTAIKTAYAPPKTREPDDPQPLHVLKVEWQAADDNKDTLRYTLEARPHGDSKAPYVKLAEDLTASHFEWDTRTAPDGRYVLRVTASDGADNVPEQALSSSRRSDPVIVDNTAPEFQDVRVQKADGGIRITATARDALSPVQEIRVKVGSEKDWRLVLPQDLIYDSTSETVSVKLPGLPAGGHAVTLRATDALGNSRHLARTVVIEP